MKLKIDEDSGFAVVKDGHPVYVTDDGTEQTVNVPEMQIALAKANHESADRRGALQTANARLKLFGELDPDKAKAAVAFKDSLGEDFDADKATHQMAELKATNAGLTTQVEDMTAKLETGDKAIDSLTRGNEIATSAFVQTKVAAALRSPDRFLAESAYGNHVARDENGKVIVKGADGQTIMSEKNPGQPASLDEALPKIVAKADLAAGNASGGGENGNGELPGGAVGGAGKWGDMGAKEKSEAIRKHGTFEAAQAAHQ